MPMVTTSAGPDYCYRVKDCKRPQNFVQAIGGAPLLERALRLGDFLYEHGLQLGDFLEDALRVLVAAG
jgi:hypothetical protein